ncbi:hypothetical protein DYB32_005123 [Aphanomyces invadans]|uniref:Fe2OG dioxygenase domain-containing protein n=1 Tax=Aphanomyces invadans TaxID=157072 RepID=A0A418AVB2_9STRA|nr:hypothetical protein DYB32_005123 [Aphanomyces invadans]
MKTEPRPPNEVLGFILVTFEEIEAAVRAREALSGAIRDDLGGRKLFVQFSNEAPAASSSPSSLPCTSSTAQVVIPGLSIIEGFLSPDEEATILGAIDSRPFETSIQRRVQHYGFAFRYDTRDVDADAPLGPMPDFCASVLTRLELLRPDIATPNQVTVNEYLPGQGIAPHIDTPGVFTEYIASLSLGSDIVMDFRLASNPNIVKHILLRRGSMCLMVGEARYLWKHGIAYRNHTRHHPWPLVASFLESLAPASLVADIGCGNGKYLGINNDLMMIGSDHSIPLLTRQFKTQDVMVEWKLQQKYIDANEPVPAHVQMDNERKWAVYQRYCHVYKDLELEMLVRQAKPLDPVSTPATALTELTDEMKKDALASCSVLFGDAAFCNLLKQEGVPLDNARLLMTESVEQLLRVLVTHHKMIMSNSTPLKLGSLFLPVLALTSADPLRPDVFGVMDAVLTRLVPPLHVSTAAIAMARRPLVKLLVLYHDPTIALHLDHTLPQWSDSTFRCSRMWLLSNCVDVGESGILPDSWLASLFESSDHKSTIPLAALSNIWDCLIVNASATYPSIIGVFVVLYAILQSKKRLLSLTNATSLQSVMMQLLVETLSQSPSQLMQQVQTLINTTPFSFTTKLCDAGMETSQHTGEKSISRTNSTSNVVASPRTGSKDQLESSAATQSSGNASMSKFGASLSSMNSKFFAGASKLTASIMKNESDKSSASSNVATHSTGNNRSDSFHLESTAVYFSMTISACEVIPSVFRGFKSTCTEKVGRASYLFLQNQYLARGRIPTSFAFNSESVTDPAAFDAVMATLQPIKSSVHICIMGHGYARHANHLIKDLNIPKSLVADMLAKDAAQINDAVLFLAKRGFPYVSVVEGGYASTHRFLSKSRLFSLSDLTDHDQKACDLCQQDAALKTRGRASSVSHHSDEEDEYIQRTEGGVCLGRFGPDGRKKVVTAGTKTGRTSISSPSTASTYFNNMTNVLKDSTKTMAAVSSKTLKAVPGSDKMTDALKDSRNWMLKKTESIHLNDVSTSMTSGTPLHATTASDTTVCTHVGMRSVVDVAANPATMLKKAANSFANSLGNAEPPMMYETLDRGLDVDTISISPPTSSPGHSSHTSSVPAAAQSSCASSGSSTVKKPSSKAKEAVFSIDDDDDEEDEADSFMGDANIHDTDHTSAMTPPPSSVVVHTVSKHGVHALKKGMQIRMVDLLPLVSSPLFSCYKKKARGTETLMLPRHVVIAEDHVLVLKADKVQDDVSYVRSCHHLSHIARMTCMKKNALMVTFYLSFDGKQKQKAYEVQQRDALIKVIRTSMESLAAQKESDEDSAA